MDKQRRQYALVMMVEYSQEYNRLMKRFLITNAEEAEAKAKAKAKG